MPNKQEIWRPISLPVTSETHKLTFSNYVTDKVNGSRVQPSLSGRNKDRTRESGGNRAYMNNCSPFSFPEPALPLSMSVSLAKGNEGPGNENDCSQEACCEERKSLAHRGFVVCSLCWKNGLGYFLGCWTFYGSSVSLIGRFWVIKVSWPDSRHKHS